MNGLNPRRFLHRLAGRLAPAKPAIIGVGALCLLLTGYGLLARSPSAELLLRLGIVGALWCGLLFSSIELFRHLPLTPGPHQGLRLRLVLKAKNLLYSALAFLVAGIGLFLLSMSVRLLFLDG